MPDPFRLPRIKNLDRIVDAQGRPTIQFIKFFNTDFAGAVERQEAAQAVILEDLAQAQADIIAAQAEIVATQDAQAAIIADLDAEVDRLTAVLAGTGEPFTGVNVGGINVKPLLDRSNGSRFNDVTAIPGNVNTTSATRPGLVLSIEGDGVGPTYTSANVGITAHSFKLGATTVSLDGGTITGLTLSPGEYYLYYDDPDYAGGAVTYVATRDIDEATGAVGRFILGRANPPLSDGTGGTVTQAQPSWNLT